jgi:hypothetical protein
MLFGMEVTRQLAKLSMTTMLKVINYLFQEDIVLLLKGMVTRAEGVGKMADVR